LPASVVGFVLLHGALRGLGSMRPLIVLWQIALPLARVLLAAVFALGIASLSAAVLSWALLPVPVAVAAVVLARRRVRDTLPDDLLARPIVRPWKSFWSFASARGAASCFEICIIWLDVILMTILRGPHDAGIYAAASRFITTGTLA